MEIVKLLVIVLAAFVLAACALQEGLIFFPQPAGPAPQLKPPAVLEEISLKAGDGTALKGWLARHSPGRAPLLIYFGGNAEETSWFIARSQRFAGWSVLSVNYRGYGGSEGSPGEKALFADALSVYDHAMKLRDIDATRIVVMGRSLGSGVAVHLASQRPVAGTVLVTPFDSLVEVGARHYPFLPVRWMLRHPFDSAAIAPSLKSSALVIAADRDNVVPAQHARRLFDAWGGPREWLEVAGAGHNDVDSYPAYWDAVHRFLAKAGGVK